MAMALETTAPAGEASLEDLLASWDGRAVVMAHDEPTGATIFICVHSTTLGPAVGGTRMKPYRTAADALNDGLRLSAAMTAKSAVAGMPFGGGKAVISVPEVPQGEERRGLLLRYGALIESLGGVFRTGQDMNTGQSDMDVIGEATSYVYGKSPERGGCGTPSPSTANGVLNGVRASLAHVFGSAEPAGRTVVIQGVGEVGDRLAGLLAEQGARVIVSDVSDERAWAVAMRIGGSLVAPENAATTPCDVFAPCAVGGVLNADTIPALRCSMVAGAANNQLAEEADAERLRARGILYAPDYVINAGGIIGGGREALSWSTREVERRLEGIGETLLQLYRSADAEGISTNEAADRLARDRLRAGASLLPSGRGRAVEYWGR